MKMKLHHNHWELNHKENPEWNERSPKKDIFWIYIQKFQRRQSVNEDLDKHFDNKSLKKMKEVISWNQF